MKRHTTTNNSQRKHGERQLSASARAAMARAAGHPADRPETAPRTLRASLRRNKMRIRSILYRLVYDAAVISGDPAQQSRKARRSFLGSLLGCVLCVYVPLMGVSRVLVRRAPAPREKSNRLEHLERRSFPHGSFFLGSTSHEAAVERSWISAQRKLLDDGDVDAEIEKRRCTRHGLGHANETSPRRRRLFLGALLADESMDVLRAIGAEGYGVFHSVSLVESNVTRGWSPRDLRFGPGSENLSELRRLFGPQTRVSVDYYVPSPADGGDLEALQREGNVLRWGINGMGGSDVAVVADADETFSRDFLRALQTCDIPEIRPGRGCRGGGARASSLVYEGSADCVSLERRRHSPVMILGECVDGIGGDPPRPSSERGREVVYGNGKESHFAHQNHSTFKKEGLGSAAGSKYPLWSVNDVRMDDAGEIYTRSDGAATGYHFHNFFTTHDEIHRKYHTHGHIRGVARARPLGGLHEDLALGVDCARGERNGRWLEFSRGSGNTLPVYYLDEEVRAARHVQWQGIVKADEKWWNRNKTTTS